MKSSGWTIGQAAGRFGLATHVLRHWEAVGLLDPGRGPGGQRRYTDDDLRRIAMILLAKDSGLSLEAVRDMFTAPDQSVREAVLRRQRAAVEERIAKARAALSMIDAALACEHGDFVTCPRFQAKVTLRVGEP